LRSYVKNVRRIIDPGRAGTGPAGGVVPTIRSGYVLRVTADMVDATRLEGRIREARDVLRANPSAGAAILRGVVADWHGAAYGDLAAETFVCAEAARLDELRLAAEEDLIGAEVVLGRHSEWVGRLEQLVGFAMAHNGMRLMHGVMSYCGDMMLCITSDRDMMPDRAVYTDCLEQSFQEPFDRDPLKGWG
jgi:DNA-binding SARP family transcriptional activator